MFAGCSRALLLAHAFHCCVTGTCQECGLPVGSIFFTMLVTTILESCFGTLEQKRDGLFHDVSVGVRATVIFQILMEYLFFSQDCTL